MADNLKRSLSADSERKYLLISRATIRLFAESEGHTISEDVVRVLTEDVNYRLREIVSVGSQRRSILIITGSSTVHRF